MYGNSGISIYRNSDISICRTFFRAFVGTPFRLRDHIPRESVTSGLHGTTGIVAGHRGTPQDGLPPPRDSTGYFLRELATTGPDEIVCAGFGHRCTPRDWIEPQKDQTGLFVRDAAVLHGICVYGIQTPRYSTIFLCTGCASK